MYIGTGLLENGYLWDKSKLANKMLTFIIVKF